MSLAPVKESLGLLTVLIGISGSVGTAAIAHYRIGQSEQAIEEARQVHQRDVNTINGALDRQAARNIDASVWQAHVDDALKDLADTVHEIRDAQRGRGR